MAWGYAAQKATPEEAKKMVEEAVAYVKANGEEKAVKDFNKPKSKFVKGELYVFAYDLNGVVVAHPVLPQNIGKDFLNTPDSKGKLFRKEAVELMKTKGSGFVDYTFLNPVTKKEEPKTTYYQKTGGLIIGCGAYILRGQVQDFIFLLSFSFFESPKSCDIQTFYAIMKEIQAVMGMARLLHS